VHSFGAQDPALYEEYPSAHVAALQLTGIELVHAWQLPSSTESTAEKETLVLHLLHWDGSAFKLGNSSVPHPLVSTQVDVDDKK
jgi:hypothetical protein